MAKASSNKKKKTTNKKKTPNTNKKKTVNSKQKTVTSNKNVPNNKKKETTINKKITIDAKKETTSKKSVVKIEKTKATSNKNIIRIEKVKTSGNKNILNIEKKEKKNNTNVTNTKGEINKKKITVEEKSSAKLKKSVIDAKLITYLINIYFTIFIWFLLMVTIFQISNEIPLISFLILSLVYFFLEICKGLTYYKLFRTSALNLQKDGMEERLRRANKMYKIMNAIVCTYIFITLAMYCVYIVYFIKKTNTFILLLTIIFFGILIIYNLINQFVHRN